MKLRGTPCYGARSETQGAGTEVLLQLKTLTANCAQEFFTQELDGIVL